MSWSKSIAQYADIAAHLDTIIHTNTRQCRFPTPAMAQLWRSRVYMYRSILRESSGDGRCQFDQLVFRITKDDLCTVHIFEGYPDNITFLTADGQPISLVEPKRSNVDQGGLRQAIAAREALDKRLNSDSGPSDVDLNQFGFDAFGTK